MYKSSRKLGIRICGLDIIILLLGLTIANLGSNNIIPVEPGITTQATFAIFILLGLAASASFLVAGNPSISYIPAQQPKSPEYGVIKRFIKDKITGKEYIISGPKECTYREALIRNWPIPSRNRNSQWVIVDEFGNDITERFLSEYDSVAEIIFN